MYEDGAVYFEDISEEEYKLVCNTFANELCGWVAYEVYKKRGQDMKQLGTYPGACFYLKGYMVHINPYSADQVEVECMATNPQICVLSPEKAIEFILKI